MSCRQCGLDSPAYANFCLHCGTSLRWEHRDLVIQLGLTTHDLPLESETRRRFDQLVVANLRAIASEGWHAEGPIDWRSLVETSRLRVWAHAGVGGHMLLDSVSVRVRRALSVPVVEPVADAAA